MSGVALKCNKYIFGYKISQTLFGNVPKLALTQPFQCRNHSLPVFSHALFFSSLVSESSNFSCACSSCCLSPFVWHLSNGIL